MMLMKMKYHYTLNFTKACER